MNYTARFKILPDGAAADDITVSLEKEGLRAGEVFLDFADVDRICPNNHRVILDMFDGSGAEVSMLGFSFDGFWEELVTNFGNRSMEALFIEEETIMRCEGEYELPAPAGSVPERGRGEIILTGDAVIILPPTSHAVRIPLCFTSEIRSEGYQIVITMNSGKIFRVGKMGYDTIPFAERCEVNAEKTMAERKAMKNSFGTKEPFGWKGLFRTNQKEEHWAAAFGEGTCAVELYTKDDSATYLYKFGDKELFTLNLEEAMEAVGSHREIIFISEDQLNARPLYRMAVHRSEAVRFLRSCSAGRIIHSASHREKLEEFLG